jgi:hypothetical protein
MKMAWFISLLCVSSLLASPQAEPPPPTPPTLPPSEEAKRPDLPTLQPDPTDPEQRIQREARSSLLPRSGLLLPLNTTWHFHTLAIVDMHPRPELPVDAEIDAIVSGEIVDKQIFVTPSKRGLYTEYTLQVERMLRALDQVIPDSRISILRPGGLRRDRWAEPFTMKSAAMAPTRLLGRNTCSS